MILNKKKRLYMTYWNNKGKHQELYDFLYTNLVPDFGTSDTIEGEFLNIANKFFYDLYNNGLCNIDVLHTSFELLSKSINEIALQTKSKEYSSQIEALCSSYLENQELSDENCDYVTCDYCNGDNEDCDYCDGDGETYEEVSSEQEDHFQDTITPIINWLMTEDESASLLFDDILIHISSVTKK